jgi:hypothetical protein
MIGLTLNDDPNDRYGNLSRLLRVEFHLEMSVTYYLTPA